MIMHSCMHAYTHTYIHTFFPDAAERYPLGEAIVTGSHPGYLEPCALHTSTETCDARAYATTSRGGSSSCTCHGWPIVQHISIIRCGNRSIEVSLFQRVMRERTANARTFSIIAAPEALSGLRHRAGARQSRASYAENCTVVAII